MNSSIGYSEGAEVPEDKTPEYNELQEKHAHYLVLKAYNALNDFITYACINNIMNDKIKSAQEIRDAVSTLAHTMEKSIKSY